MSKQECTADDPGTGPQRVRVRITWPDGRSAEEEMPLSEAATLVEPLLGWRQDLERRLELARAEAGDDLVLLEAVARQRSEVESLPILSVHPVADGTAMEEPAWRAATPDDLASFIPGGTWVVLSEGDRLAAIARSLATAADSGQGNARIDAIDSFDIHRAIFDADEAAWQRIWYACRGLNPYPHGEEPGDGGAPAATKSSTPGYDPKLTPLVPNWPTAYPAAYHALAADYDRERNPDGLGRRPHRLEVARQLRISRKTLYVYLCATGEPFPPK